MIDCSRIKLTNALFLILLVVAAACSRGLESQKIVEAYQNAANNHQIDSLMTLYSRDASADFIGVGGSLTGLDALRDWAMYDSMLHSQRSLVIARAHKDSVICAGTENNDWLTTLNLPPSQYSSVIFIVQKGKIHSLSMELDNSSAARINTVMGQLIPWAQENRPEAFSVLMGEGEFKFTAQSAQIMLELARQWRNQAGMPKP